MFQALQHGSHGVPPTRDVRGVVRPAQGRFMQRAGPAALRGGQDASRRKLLKQKSMAKAAALNEEAKLQAKLNGFVRRDPRSKARARRTLRTSGRLARACRIRLGAEQVLAVKARGHLHE